jgi:type I restriction-modification system DNA methylase subunit
MHWVFDNPQPELQLAAKHTADAALRNDQLDLTGTDKRYDTDLLGAVLPLLKSDSASKTNAQIYTPTPVADMMARMTVPEEGSSVCDPAVGTGGLLRATAQVMREHGHDPATVVWYGADIDDLAIAACAINSLQWQLGPRILLCVANTLAEDDWASRAEAQRTEILQLTKTIRRDKLMTKFIRTAQRLTELTVDGDGPDTDKQCHDHE